MLRFGGNFTQAATPSNGPLTTFSASGTHQVVLNGTSAQTERFDGPQSSNFHHLETDNPAGITFNGSLPLSAALSIS